MDLRSVETFPAFDKVLLSGVELMICTQVRHGYLLKTISKEIAICGVVQPKIMEKILHSAMRRSLETLVSLPCLETR
jgi:hypothetical protein